MTQIWSSLIASLTSFKAKAVEFFHFNWVEEGNAQEIYLTFSLWFLSTSNLRSDHTYSHVDLTCGSNDNLIMVFVIQFDNDNTTGSKSYFGEKFYHHSTLNSKSYSSSLFIWIRYLWIHYPGPACWLTAGAHCCTWLQVPFRRILQPLQDLCTFRYFSTSYWGSLLDSSVGTSYPQGTSFI